MHSLHDDMLKKLVQLYCGKTKETEGTYTSMSRKKPVRIDWWRNESVRKTGLMCLGGGSVGWGEWGWVSGNFFGVSGKLLGNFPELVRNRGCVWGLQNDIV